MLAGFVSQRTHRPFKAYLALDKDGKVSFKFDETAGKAASARKKAASSVTAKKTETAKTTSARKTAGRKRTVKKETTDGQV